MDANAKSSQSSDECRFNCEHHPTMWPETTSLTSAGNALSSDASFWWYVFPRCDTGTVCSSIRKLETRSKLSQSPYLPYLRLRIRCFLIILNFDPNFSTRGYIMQPSSGVHERMWERDVGSHSLGLTSRRPDSNGRNLYQMPLSPSCMSVQTLTCAQNIPC